MSYNGWSNKETWLICLWFSLESREDVENAEEYFWEIYKSLPDFMKDFVSTTIDLDELKEYLDEEETTDETL